MTPAPNTYEVDARWIASELANQKETTNLHRTELMKKLEELSQNFSDWKEEVRDANQSFHGRISVLEEGRAPEDYDPGDGRGGLWNSSNLAGKALLGSLKTWAKNMIFW